MNSNYFLKSTKCLRNSIRYVSNKNSLGVIGVPFHKGQKKIGVDYAPTILRENGLIESLKTLDCLKINDYGNISYKLNKYCDNLDNMLNYDDFISCNKELTQKVQEILKENDKILVLGGDHSIGFGSLAGHLACDPNLALVWVDAHSDINLNKSSLSGSIHGMPVSMILEELKNNWKSSNIEKLMKNYLPAKNLFYIGLRDIDTFESFLLQKLNITAYGMNSVDSLGINKILEIILDKADPNSKIHISFDIDALDINEAPSTGTPVAGGLTLREGLVIVETLAETNRISAFDLVEVNPKIGSKNDAEQTVRAGLNIIKAAFGYNRNGNPSDNLQLSSFK